MSVHSSRPATGGLVAAGLGIHRGDFRVRASFDVAPGSIVAILGPNGSGKSTLLQGIAGLVTPDEGRIELGGVVVHDERVDVPVARRRVGLLGQDPLVFPHLSARENVAFGPRAAGRAAGLARREADEWLAAVGLAGMEGRRPDELSGGQRQRVALARALAAEPAALLLDEPFAQLDVRTAAELRDLVAEQVRATGTPTVLVTHDALDALTLADHVVVLQDGQVVVEGAPLDVLGQPTHPFTAALADVNLLRGRLERRGDGWVLAAGGVAVRLSAISDEPPRPREAFLTFSPGEAWLRRPAADRWVENATAVGTEVHPPLAWSSRVVDLERGPRGVRVRTTGDVVVDLTPVEAAGLGLRAGDEVVVGVPAAAARLS